MLRHWVVTCLFAFAALPAAAAGFEESTVDARASSRVGGHPSGITGERSTSDGEASPSGRLVVTVLDQSGGVIPSASVTLTPPVPGPDRSGARQVASNAVGIVVMEDLLEGIYTLRAEFPGFEPAVLEQVRVRGGRETRVRVTLQIRKLDEAVTVTRDRQTTSLDPRGSAFSSVLTREQIDALPDDPDEMEEALKALAPPGAVIRVDGFTGGKLPPKSQIRSIRLPRMDMFAAQNHGGMSGVTFIDIMTTPGNGPMRGNVDFNVLDDALNARNPFTPTKGAEQLRQYGYALAGTIRPNRTAFSVNGSGGAQYTSPNLMAVLPDGETVTDTIRQPRDSFSLMARVDHAINKDHALRASFDRTSTSSRNLGVGGYDLFDRAFDTHAIGNTIRVSENGPIGRRMFTETRFQLRWGDTTSRSSVEAPTIRVQDAFTSGGAQQRGGQQSRELEIASDLDYVRGAHSWRTGVLFEGASFTANDMTNYLGTYTFASLAAYDAGRPSGYTRRIGDPRVRYSTGQAAVYLQDDWRVARSVLISPGIRYGLQQHVGDYWNVSPRFSMAWSPFRNGNLTLRASYGYFYDWVPGDLYKQSVLVDGARQRELNVHDPSYPDPGLIGTSPPSNRYLWPGELDLPNAHRLSAGMDRTLSQNSRVTASYAVGWGRGLLRGRNLNPPVNGVRPDPSYANVVSLAGDAASRSQGVNVMYTFVRMDRRRLFLAVNYAWTSSRTNTSGGFSMPAGLGLDSEWGPAAADIRHRLGASFNMSPFKNVSVGLNLRGQSGMPYNVTTGSDNNGDGVFNDRPASVGRNSARGAAQWDLGGRVAYAWGFGTPRKAVGGPGQVAIQVGGGGSQLAPAFGGGATDKRYRLEVYVSGQNLLNRANFTAYSFVMTSPFFGTPVASAQPRKFQVGVRFGF